MSLTASQQGYMQAVYELAGCGEGAHVSDIAQKMGVNKASASVAVKTLQRKRLVKRDTRHKVFLTPEGMRQAVCMTEKSVTIKRFLLETLKVDATVARRDAGMIGQLISPETCRRLHNWIGSSCSECRPKTE